MKAKLVTEGPEKKVRPIPKTGFERTLVTDGTLKLVKKNRQRLQEKRGAAERKSQAGRWASKLEAIPYQICAMKKSAFCIPCVFAIT
jgi:hypothetical protein